MLKGSNNCCCRLLLSCEKENICLLQILVEAHACEKSHKDKNMRLVIAKIVEKSISG